MLGWGQAFVFWGVGHKVLPSWSLGPKPLTILEGSSSGCWLYVVASAGRGPIWGTFYGLGRGFRVQRFLCDMCQCLGRKVSATDYQRLPVQVHW